MIETIGVILAGGLARRMGGGDKCFLPLLGRPILNWVAERAAPQTTYIIINANGDASRFDDYAFPVVADPVEGFQGPLAGILAAMDWGASQHPDIKWIVSFPGDAPFVPPGLVQRYLDAVEAEGADLATAHSAGRSHPVCGLWSTSLAGDLRHALIEEKIRKIDLWTARHCLAEVAFETDPYDPFFNINETDDLKRAEDIARLVTASST
jgi:molybdopterin-guanine dinucleotide biosynthesis protein A